MGAFIDLTGMKFGKWTVLYKANISTNKKIFWHCKCECDREKDVDAGNLRSGGSTCCGKCSNINDLTGMQFGRWTVLKLAKSKNHQSKWLCRCNCENKTERIVFGFSLVSGESTSCGCRNREIVSKTHKKYNVFILDGEFGIGICSNKNVCFYFDLEDYEKIKDYCWHITPTGYISTGGKNRTGLHNVIMDSKYIDHIDGKTEDNRKKNLRKYYGGSGNSKNHKIFLNNTTGASGVAYNKKEKRFKSYICHDGIRENLGSYKTIEEAIRVRKEA
jgi:hypothetical protein